MLATKRLGKPDTGNPSVRFDEGSEPYGIAVHTMAPAYSTNGKMLAHRDATGLPSSQPAS